MTVNPVLSCSNNSLYSGSVYNFVNVSGDPKKLNTFSTRPTDFAVKCLAICSWQRPAVRACVGGGVGACFTRIHDKNAIQQSFKHGK